MRHDDSLLAKKLNASVQLSERELQCLAELQSSPVRVERGKELVREGQAGHMAYTRLDRARAADPRIALHCSTRTGAKASASGIATSGA
jgi:hypothetical protein